MTQWSIRLFDSLTGANVNVPGGSGIVNTTSFSFPFNSVSGYREEFTGICHGRKCECQFWIQTKAMSFASKRAGSMGKKL